MFVKVVSYNSNWPKAFEQESSKLKLMLGAVLDDIHHIGSTAVPGLMAKPIIDILLEVSNLKSLDGQNFKMEGMGYEALGEYGIIGRRYFRKGGYHRSHQIHAFRSGDPHVTRHLAFRDYLIAHEEIARAYGKLKWEIAQNCENDLEKYCDAKDPFVKLHEQRALEWYERSM